MKCGSRYRWQACPYVELPWRRQRSSADAQFPAATSWRHQPWRWRNAAGRQTAPWRQLVTSLTSRVRLSSENRRHWATGDCTKQSTKSCGRASRLQLTAISTRRLDQRRYRRRFPAALRTAMSMHSASAVRWTPPSWQLSAPTTSAASGTRRRRVIVLLTLLWSLASPSLRRYTIHSVSRPLPFW